MEVDSQPARVALALEIGQELAIYLVPEDPAAPRLRATVLRRAEDPAPAGAELLLSAELGESGRHRVLRVRQVGPVPVELFRTDSRARVVIGTEMRNGARLDVAREERPPVQLSLQFAQAAQGMRASVGGGGTRASAAQAAQSTLLWLVPNVIQVIRDPLDDIKDGTLEWIGKSGISPRTFSAFLVILFTTVGTGAFGLTQYFAASDASAQAQVATAQAAASEAGKQEALASEAQCMVDRRALAEKAGERETARRAAVEGALARGPARTLAVEKGGHEYDDSALLRFDAEAFDDDVRAALALLDAAAPEARLAARCATQTDALARDLPPHVLYVHPDPTLACPEAYQAILGAAAMRGSWGLSDRSATELRPAAQLNATDPTQLVDGFDARDVDRLSATMLAFGVRSIRAVLFDGTDHPRPFVAPSEANLWALALFEAANRLPPPSPGSPPATLPECVAQVLDARLEAQTTAAPGQPALPSVARGASGAETIPAAPTASCPWPENVIRDGAASALHAVARAAAAETTPTEEP